MLYNATLVAWMKISSHGIIVFRTQSAVSQTNAKKSIYSEDLLDESKKSCDHKTTEDEYMKNLKIIVS